MVMRCEEEGEEVVKYEIIVDVANGPYHRLQQIPQDRPQSTI